MSHFLYIGAFDDAVPLTYGSVLAHDQIIYVDALPKLRHFSPGCHGHPASASEGAICAYLLQQLYSFGCSGSYRQVTAGEWEIDLIRDKKLQYFFNILDIEMHEHPVLQGYLHNVSTLWLCGFRPHSSIYKHLPNLRKVYVSDAMDCGKFRKSIPKGTKIHVFDEYEYSCDIERCDDGPLELGTFSNDKDEEPNNMFEYIAGEMRQQ